MSTNSKAMKAMGRDGTINTDAGSRMNVGDTRRKGFLNKIKHFIGKVVAVDEDWIFKSNEWPYMWKKK